MHHIANIQKFGVTPVVAINRFSTDTEGELNKVRELCLASGAFAAVVANHWAEGGAGATDLGNAVIAACKHSREIGSPFKCLYPLSLSLKEKIETVCRDIYGAAAVDYTELAEERLAVRQLLLLPFPYIVFILIDSFFLSFSVIFCSDTLKPGIATYLYVWQRLSIHSVLMLRRKVFQLVSLSLSAMSVLLLVLDISILFVVIS